jgi:hypothetical protein
MLGGSVNINLTLSSWSFSWDMALFLLLVYGSVQLKRGRLQSLLLLGLRQSKTRLQLGNTACTSLRPRLELCHITDLSVLKGRLSLLNRLLMQLMCWLLLL